MTAAFVACASRPRIRLTSRTRGLVTSRRRLNPSSLLCEVALLQNLFFIHTGLQPGGKQTLLRNRFNGFAVNRGKPLKRLVAFSSFNTGLKPGVNEKVLLGHSLFTRCKINEIY